MASLLAPIDLTTKVCVTGYCIDQSVDWPLRHHLVPEWEREGRRANLSSTLGCWNRAVWRRHASGTHVLQSIAARPGQSLFNRRHGSSKKSKLTAYALWYFAGGLGAHNFYLGKPVLGALQVGAWPFLFCMLLIAKWIGTESVVAQVVGFTGVGGLGLAIISIVLIDPFLIPSRVRAHSDRLRARLEAEAEWQAA